MLTAEPSMAVIEGFSLAMRELPGHSFEPDDCGSPPPKAIQP